jgi:hypothetical protein
VVRSLLPPRDHRATKITHTAPLTSQRAGAIARLVLFVECISPAMWRKYIEPVALVRTLFQALESLEPNCITDHESLQAEIWEAFEHDIFSNKYNNHHQRGTRM